MDQPTLGILETDWFDVALLAAAARLRPSWTFVIVGPVVDVDVRRLERCPNVLLVGERPYRDLPAWARAFDVALIPHRLQARTHGAGFGKLERKAMIKRLPWGHQSRHCCRCGKVGPRCQVLGGWAHFYCLSPQEKRARRTPNTTTPNAEFTGAGTASGGICGSTPTKED